MKKSTTKISNIVKVVLILLAFTFSGNVDASTTATVGKNWKPKKNKNWTPKKNSKPKYCKPKPPKCKPNQQPRKRRKRCPKVPIDGGLGILVLGAAAFGARKLREKK